MHLLSSRCVSLNEACLPCTIRLTSPRTRWAPWNLALSDSESLHWAYTRHSFGWNWMHPRHQVHLNFLGSTALVAAHLILQRFLPLFPNKPFYHPGYYIKWRIAWFLYALLKLQMQKNQHMNKKLYQNNPQHPLFLRWPPQEWDLSGWHSGRAGWAEAHRAHKPVHSGYRLMAHSHLKLLWPRAGAGGISLSDVGFSEAPQVRSPGGRWQGWWTPSKLFVWLPPFPHTHSSEPRWPPQGSKFP